MTEIVMIIRCHFHKKNPCTYTKKIKLKIAQTARSTFEENTFILRAFG